jgi:hypothetical protein
MLIAAVLAALMRRCAFKQAHELAFARMRLRRQAGYRAAAGRRTRRLQPLSERGGRWLKHNLFNFPGAACSRTRASVELSEVM